MNSRFIAKNGNPMPLWYTPDTPTALRVTYFDGHIEYRDSTKAVGIVSRHHEPIKLELVEADPEMGAEIVIPPEKWGEVA